MGSHRATARQNLAGIFQAQKFGSSLFEDGTHLSPGKHAPSNIEVLFSVDAPMGKVSVAEKMRPVYGSTVGYKLQLSGREQPWGEKYRRLRKRQPMWSTFDVSGLVLETFKFES